MSLPRTQPPVTRGLLTSRDSSSSITNLILFPQNSLVLLLLADLLVISQLLVHLLGHGGLSLDGQLVLE